MFAVSFWEEISEIFGKDVKPLEGLLMPGVFEVEPPPHHQSVGSKLFSLSVMGNPVALYLSNLFVSFVESVTPKCSERQYTAYIWEKMADAKKNPYGLKESKYILEGTSKGLFLNGRAFRKGARIYKGSFTLYMSEDPLTKSLFGTSLPENLSLARTISALTEEGIYGWKPVKIKLSSNPLIALGQARAKFGDKLGGISSGKLYYPNPEHMFNRPAFSEMISYMAPLDRLKYENIYKLMVDARRAFAFGMNMAGKVLELKEKKARELRFLMKEVIVPQELASKKWKEDIDYVVVDNLIVTTLATLILSLNKDGMVYLTFTDNSLHMKDVSGTALREVSLKKTHPSDIAVKYTYSKNKIWAKYMRTLWKEDIFPLTFEEHYTIESFEDNVAVVMHP